MLTCRIVYLLVYLSDCPLKYLYVFIYISICIHKFVILSLCIIYNMYKLLARHPQAGCLYLYGMYNIYTTTGVPRPGRRALGKKQDTRGGCERATRAHDQQETRFKERDANGRRSIGVLAPLGRTERPDLWVFHLLRFRFFGTLVASST